MSRRLFNLISIITTAASMVAIGVVTYLNLPAMVAINDSISIAEGAVIAICANFIKD